MVITGIQHQRAAVASEATMNCAWPSRLGLATDRRTACRSVARDELVERGESEISPGRADA
jgi:hypothetical protein